MRTLSWTFLGQALWLSTPVMAAFPLERTEISVDIAGPFAELTVEQVFHNTYEDFMEARYVFPLQDDAAVDAVAMQVGDREIRAGIQRRDEARRSYERARDAGRTASLTEQERPNVFTQNVANIPPGESIHVMIHLVQPLEYDDGTYRFTMPLVVGPRFIPDGVQDGQRISPPLGIPHQDNHEDEGHRVDLRLHADLGLPMARVASPTHPEAVTELEDQQLWLDMEGILADRDFVLDLTPDTNEPAISFLAQDGHFSLLLEPGAHPPAARVLPRELVFVVDTSGSMNGDPLDQARSAMRTAIQGLLPGDTFQVIRFSESSSSLADAPLEATPENIRKGLAFVDDMSSSGGTRMLAGVQAALAYSPSRDGAKGRRKRIVCMLTDGYIGNEREILGAVTDAMGDSSIFVLGVGSSVNRYLLDRLADLGRGRAIYLLPGDSPREKVQEFYDAIARPVLADIRVDWGSMEVRDVYPRRPGDLYAGQPLVLTGRYQGEPGLVTVSGRMGHAPYSQTVELEELEGGDALPVIWARSRVRALEGSLLWGEDQELEEEITSTALRYGIMSRFTSFVAVERRIRNREGYILSLEQPLELPAGMSWGSEISSGLSRSSTRPGDPLLTVDAPQDCPWVSAVLPWGELVRLRWDPLRQRWYHRFLVPREVRDGIYTVRVFVMMADGRTETLERRLEVDSSEPELDATAEWLEGGTLVRIHVEEPLRSIQVYPDGRPDSRLRVDMRVEPWCDEDVVELYLHGLWEQVVVVVKDLAMNRSVRVIRPREGGF